MRRTILSLMTVAALVPAVVSAQATSDATANARIQASIEAAARAGVPRSALENKVAEGRAKGASSARIAAAVEKRADVMTRVHAAMQNAEPQGSAEAVTTAELIAASDAHENGVSIESISSLSARAGNDRAVALTVLADLIASGRTGPSQALVRVETALQAGSDALARLGSSVGSSVSTGISSNRPAVGAQGTGTANADAKAPKANVTGTGVLGVRVGGN